MAITGEVYGTVEASVANYGIATLSISGGTPIEGSESGDFYIQWQYDPESSDNGISGHGWFIGDPNAPTYGYDSNVALESYLSSLSTEEQKSFLDGIFAAWDSSKISSFYEEHVNQPENVIHGCSGLIQ